MKISNLCNHIAHPFFIKSNKSSIKIWQKCVSLGVGLLLLPACILPGLLAFYGAAYYFKSKAVKPTTSAQTSKIDSISQNTLSRNSSNTKKQSSASSKTKTADYTSCRLFIKKGVIQELFENVKDESYKPDEILDQMNILETKLAKSNITMTAFLEFLSKEKPRKHLSLFTAVLSTQNEIAIKKFLNAAGKEQLEAYTLQSADITLKIGNKKIPMNRAILSSFIPFFKDLFHANMKDTEQDEISIDSAHSELVAALEFMIFDDLEITDDNYQSLLSCASFYRLEALQEYCEKWILKNIDDFDRSILLNFADHFQLENVPELLFRRF